MEFYDLDAKKVVASVNGDRLFVPGSTTKLLTMGTALEVLGGDHRFRTRVYRTGPIRADGSYSFVDRDHSYGGLPVATDPLLTLRDIARQIAARGITAVTGQVIVDASLFDEGARELGTRIVLSPMVVNDNVIDIVVTPGALAGDPATVEVSPRTSYLTVQARITTADSGSAVAVRSSEDSANVDHRVLVVTGRVPRGAPANVRWAVASPTRFGDGRRARVAAVDGRSGGTAQDESEPAREQLAVVPRIAAGVTGRAQERVRPRARLADARGTRPRRCGAVQGDGAGGDAFFSPRFMSRYLALIATRPWAQAFLDALPVLGRDGTLATIQVASPGAGKVFAKTGTYSTYDPLNRRTLVTGKGLAGYFTSKSGRRIAFAIYVNNLAVKAGEPAIVAGQALGPARRRQEGRPRALAPAPRDGM